MAVTVGKDGYLKVFDLHHGRELTTQRVPKPMARTNTAILDFFGTTRYLVFFPQELSYGYNIYIFTIMYYTYVGIVDCAFTFNYILQILIDIWYFLVLVNERKNHLNIHTCMYVNYKYSELLFDS